MQEFLSISSNGEPLAESRRCSADGKWRATEPPDLSSVASGVLALLLPVTPSASSVETYTIDGVKREAIVYAGTGPAPKTGRPLVLAFHGHGGNMRYSERKHRIETLWPEAMAVYPQGLPTKGMTDPEGKKNGWQQQPRDGGGRDLKFVDAILARTKGYDPKRVYVMGHSNGGRFTYVLWAERGEKFAAYGPSGSPALRPFARLKPAPFLATAGESDPIIAFRTQKIGIDALLRRAGAELSTGTKSGPLTLAKGKDGIEVGTYFYPGGHEYPDEAVEATIAFFKRIGG